MDKEKVGLALGSGGILGLAHIGAIKVLLKNNIPIDSISGSSVGSLIGAYLSIHGEVDSLEKLLLENSKEYMPLFFDFSLNGGIIDGNKINNFLKKILGDIEFSETKKPLFIVATDITNRESVFFSSGKLVPAIRGSISIPVVFKPFPYQNKLLVDGGLTNPLPVDILKENGANKVIAINLYNQYSTENNKLTFTKVAINSGRIILNRLAKMTSQNADILISPDAYSFVNKIKVINYFKPDYIRKVIEIGEEETIKSLPQIKKILRIP